RARPVDRTRDRARPRRRSVAARPQAERPDRPHATADLAAEPPGGVTHLLDLSPPGRGERNSNVQQRRLRSERVLGDGLFEDRDRLEAIAAGAATPEIRDTSLAGLGP